MYFFKPKMLTKFDKTSHILEENIKNDLKGDTDCLCMQEFVKIVGCCADNNVVTFACWRHAVAQLFESLCYKPEGRGFDSRWCNWNFFIPLLLQATLYSWPWG